MTKPRLAMQTDRGRMYVNQNHPGRKLPSVTTVLKVLDKPALVGWAAKMVAEETLNRLPYWTRKVRAVGLTEAIREAKGSPYAKRDKAAQRGTDVHHAAEAVILGKPYTVDAEIEPYVKQTVAAFEALGIDFEASEATVANVDAGYAGTGDIWGRPQVMGGGLWLLDIKTGDESKAPDVVYPEYAYQLAALRHCTELWLPDHSIVDAPVVDRCAVLNIRPNDWALIPISEQRAAETFDIFLFCLRLFQTLEVCKDEMFEGRWSPHVAAEGPFVGDAQDKPRTRTAKKAS